MNGPLDGVRVRERMTAYSEVIWFSIAERDVP
jgi:hypothetical protein